MHNATVTCGDHVVLTRQVFQCQRDLQQAAAYGYPWSNPGDQEKSNNNPNVTNRKNTTLTDPLDSLNNVCHILDRSRSCLKENNVQDYCLDTTIYMFVQMDFQFICHNQDRDENLVRSLQCLHDTRLLPMLYFHIADRCRGFDILDNVTRRVTNAYFYNMDVEPFNAQPSAPLLYCLPKSVISTCVGGIVEDQCGTMTSRFVQNYISYIQDRFSQALQSAGLNSNICDQYMNSDRVSSRPPLPSDRAKLSISRLLEITGAGTALDTVYGKVLMEALHSLSGEELCSIGNVGSAYTACILTSDDRSERTKFNIIQFAHQLFPIAYHGTQCSRLESFTACWNLLHQICGPKVTGLEQHATLLVEGCNIQSEMDTVGWHWQDMLLPHYIHAGHVTVWPMIFQGLLNPVSLDDGHYSTFNSIMDDLDTVISLLQPGLFEISKKCGPKPAKQISFLLNKVRSLQRDAIQYRIAFKTAWQKNEMPN